MIRTVFDVLHVYFFLNLLTYFMYMSALFAYMPEGQMSKSDRRWHQIPLQRLWATMSLHHEKWTQDLWKSSQYSKLLSHSLFAIKVCNIIIWMKKQSIDRRNDLSKTHASQGQNGNSDLLTTCEHGEAKAIKTDPDPWVI